MQLAGIRSLTRPVIRDNERLDGWKAIANFLGRERSTAIRWANERGLPVHRVPGGRTGTVYASRSELEAWLASDRTDARPTAALVDTAPLAPPAPPARRTVGERTLVAAIAAAVLVTLLVVVASRAWQYPDAAVSLAAVVSPTANRDTIEFARGLNSDLARFAAASPDLAVFEREAGAAPGTEYAVRTEIDRANGTIIANARLIAVRDGQVIWSRRFEQSGPALSALREQVAANIVGALRCSFGALERTERSNYTPADLGQVIAICESFQADESADALTRARQFTVAHPDLALGWAMLALVQGTTVDGARTTLRAQALANSQRAAAISPDSVGTWLARSAVVGEGPTSPEALPVADAALRSHPDVPWLLGNRSVVLFNLGYVNDSVADALAAVRSDPSSFGTRDIAVRRLAAAGRTDEALQLQAENERLWPGHPQVIANRARIAPPGAARRAADLAVIREYERRAAETPYLAYLLADLAERAGNRRTALAWLARAPVRETAQQWSLLFWPADAGLRTEPAFFRKMADLGLVRVWLARGKWPDFCAEPGLTYDCAKEAQKLQR